MVNFSSMWPLIAIRNSLSRELLFQKKCLDYLRKERIVFPYSGEWPIALYLSLRLLKNGGVAIFTGRKSSAAKIVREAAEDIFRRGISLEPPSAHSDPDEIRRFVYLFERNFGANAYLTAALGIFAHHGNTPQGVRLAIEYAMRQSLFD
jgi:hypothetical protein